ncbi:hypothetical protein BOX15_Mlig025461g1 [Macrostomum lignano]|uniref:Protein FAM60A n=2 Tax=Macrostomum lignano TaxID=282301 RepID=A0A1I8HZY8_9PLAT|nr:hypothetical protein BOX15_Mlig025461g1 [Macrostomum lignano]
MKQQFRHKDGCCICATKSSTTRFQLSTDYEANFAQVFGAKARNRSGHICNACILCVRRGCGGGSPSYAGSGINKAPYANVVDSRRGTGPKHMKQISKRNRRRELREAAAAKQANGGASGGGGGSGTSGGSANGKLQQLAEAAGVSVDLSVSASAAGLVGLNGGPSGGGCSGNGGAVNGSGSAAMPRQIGQDGEFRTPLAPPSNGATGRRRQQYYKKRVIMQPVKIPDSKEIGELFQDVMQSRCMAQSDGPLSFQQVHSAFLTTKRRRLLASSGSETASVTSTEAPESFTSDTPSAGSIGPQL